MKPEHLLLYFLLVVTCPAGNIRADSQNRILDEKSELEKLQKQVKKSQKILDSLRREEVSVQQRVANLDQKITTNRKVINRLTRQLKKIRAKRQNSEKDLQQKQELLDRTKRRYLGDIRQYYLKTACKSGNTLWESSESEINYTRQAVYMAALGAFESERVNQATELVSQTKEHLDKLTGEQHRVSSLKKKKEVSTALEQSRKQKKEKTLESLRRKKLNEGDRMLTLKQAAEEMERVIAHLEQERRARQKAGKQYHAGPSVFATLKGQLTAPFRGKIITPFGHSKDPVTRLESFSPGITIKGRPGAPVKAVAAGKVAYIGNLRGYGNFIIINHDDQYYTTYAGLGATEVTQGEFIPEATRLAVAGRDGLVKFELRKERKPLDPVKWIRIDSF